MIEGCLSIFLKNEVLTHDYFDGKEVEMRPLFDVIRLYDVLLRNEHLLNYDLSKQKMLQRVHHFVQKGFLELKDDFKVVVVNKERTFLLLDWFSGLLVPLIDTYLITLMAIEQICGKNLVLKFTKLQKELHYCIKKLYNMQVIPGLHSCLKEIIQTALERFAEMDFIEIKAFVKKNGNKS